MRYDGASALADLQTKLDGAKAVADRLIKARDAALVESEQLKKELAYAKTDIETRANDVKRVEDRLNDSRGTCRKMEQDLAKIREVIGRKAFEEIVPIVPPKGATS